jgi:hypothetical protein
MYYRLQYGIEISLIRLASSTGVIPYPKLHYKITLHYRLQTLCMIWVRQIVA